MKKRLTLLLTDEQIHKIKVKAVKARMPVNQWILDQLALDSARPAQGVDTGPDLEAGQDDLSIRDTADAGRTESPALGARDPDTATGQVNTPRTVEANDPGTSLKDKILDCTGREIEQSERDKYLVLVAEEMPGRDRAQDRVDLLNRKGIPLHIGKSKQFPYGGVWDTKKFATVLPRAKRRLGIE